MNVYAIISIFVIILQLLLNCFYSIKFNYCLEKKAIKVFFIVAYIFLAVVAFTNLICIFVIG